MILLYTKYQLKWKMQYLQMAILFAKIHGTQVLTRFGEIPMEPRSPFEHMLLLGRPPCVLVAFMTKYHEHVIRHGVYIEVSSFCLYGDASTQLYKIIVYLLYFL